MTEAEAADSTEVPRPLVAVTLKVYEVPFVNDETTQVVSGSAVELEVLQDFPAATPAA